MSGPQDNPRIKVGAFGLRPPPDQIPIGMVYIATDTPIISVVIGPETPHTWSEFFGSAAIPSGPSGVAHVVDDVTTTGLEMVRLLEKNQGNALEVLINVPDGGGFLLIDFDASTSNTEKAINRFQLTLDGVVVPNSTRGVNIWSAASEAPACIGITARVAVVGKGTSKVGVKWSTDAKTPVARILHGKRPLEEGATLRAYFSTT
jgi:hypothetical protein